MAHAILSPSSADRWMTCPASVALTMGLKDKGSDAAREGTIAHFVAEQCLTCNEDAKEHLGFEVVHWEDAEGEEHTNFVHAQVPPSKSFLYTVDARMVEGVQVYLDYVRAVVASTGGDLRVEVSVPLDHITGEKKATGTSDVTILTPDELIVVDLKYGHREVQAVHNRQMRFYASGGLRKYGLLNDFKRVRVVIVQPNVSKQPSEWDFSVEELAAFEDEVRAAAANVTRACESATPIQFAEPSDKACKYCKAKPCEAYDEMVKATTGVSFEGLGGALDKLDLIGEWVAAKQQQAMEALQAGEVVEGKDGPYKLVKGRAGPRAWTSEAEAEAVLKAARLKSSEMYSQKLISPTVAETVLAAKPKVWSKMQEFIKRSEGGLSLAPATDKRAAVKVTPIAEQFDILA